MHSIRLYAKGFTANGNSRSCYLIFENDEMIDVLESGAAGFGPVARKYPNVTEVATVLSTPAEIRSWIKKFNK